MKKFLLSIFCLLGIMSYATADNYTYTFEEKVFSENGTVALGDIEWTLSGDGGYWGYDSQYGKGQQFGSGKLPYTSLSLSTTGIQGSITKIILNTSGASNIAGTANITVGGNSFGEEITLTKTATDYTFEGSATGEIVISYTQTSSKAIYIKSITIEYTAGSTEAPAVSTPEFSVENGTYYNPFTVELTAEEGADIYYTLDGTEPTAESTLYSEAIAISEFNTTTTIKAAAVVEGEWSNIASATYSLKVAAPEFSIDGGVYEKLTGLNALKFTTQTSGATILYNNRGGDPKTAGSKSYGSLSVLSTATVKAVAFVMGAEGDSIFSDVVEEKYYISEVKPFEKATEFVAGEYVIYAENIIAVPLGETSNYGYIQKVEATLNGNFIETNAHYAFTFTEVEGGYTIQDTFGRYVYQTGSYDSFNVAKEMPAEGAVWTVSIDESTGEATITNVAMGKYIQYSTQYSSFGSYADEKGVLPVLFALGEYPTLTVTPENWGTVPAFDKVTVTCEQGIAYNESDELYAYYTIGWDYTQFEFDNVNVIDNNTIEFSFTTPIESNGDYRVTFPAGLFTLNPSGLAIASEETTVNLTVDNPNILEVTYANPENGATVNKLEHLYFEFNQDIFDNVTSAVITAEDGKEYALSVTYTDPWGDKTPNNALCLKTTEPITMPGEYTFVLKKEYVYAGTDTRIANDLTYTFTVVEGLKVTNVLPAEETECESISEIVIEFNKAVYHDYISAIWVYDETGNEYEFTKQVGEEEYQVESLKFVTETPITEAGTYIFTLEDYSVYCYNENWQQETTGTLTFTFTFNGSKITTDIENVERERGETTIYDLTGRKIEEISESGIYIINGKKVLVK